MAALGCNICREDFDSSQKRPIVGSCGHTYCHHCTTQLDDFRCAECRKEWAFLDAPPNYTILRQLEERSRSTSFQNHRNQRSSSRRGRRRQPTNRDQTSRNTIPSSQNGTGQGTGPTSSSRSSRRGRSRQPRNIDLNNGRNSSQQQTSQSSVSISSSHQTEEPLTEHALAIILEEIRKLNLQPTAQNQTVEVLPDILSMLKSAPKPVEIFPNGNSSRINGSAMTSSFNIIGGHQLLASRLQRASVEVASSLITELIDSSNTTGWRLSCDRSFNGCELKNLLNTYQTLNEITGALPSDRPFSVASHFKEIEAMVCFYRRDRKLVVFHLWCPGLCHVLDSYVLCELSRNLVPEAARVLQEYFVNSIVTRWK